MTPTKNTNIDRYRRRIQKWLESVELKVFSSEIVETNNEADVILNDLILQVKEMELDEKQRTEAEELQEREVKL